LRCVTPTKFQRTEPSSYRTESRRDEKQITKSAEFYQNVRKLVHSLLWCLTISDGVMTSHNVTYLHAFMAIVTEDNMNTVKED
jgi:hypothetical protein